MERRDFLKQTTIVGAGAIVVPGLLTSACNKEPVLPESNFSGKVLIIGAGVAGIYAGYTLNRGGYDFEILEASDRIGGRMGKNSSFADHPIDLGAQWLHGKRSIAGDLAKAGDFKFGKDKSDMMFWFNNELVDKLPDDPANALGTDSPDISFIAYATQLGYGVEYHPYLQAAAGGYGADANVISCKYSQIEEENWSSGNTDYKFENTFWDVINDSCAAPITDKIKLNTPVTAIDYSGAQIQVTAGGQDYAADKVIITVPIPILQDGDITFTPALSAEKQAAIDKIGFGPGMKVFLKFSENFYHGNTVGGSVCSSYVDDKEGKNGSDNILLAFVMGDAAQALSDLGDDDAIAQALVAELDTIYGGKASTSYQDKLVIDYTTMPHIRGAYSFSSIGIGEARKTAAEDIDDKIFFAGEAFNLDGHHQSVHGALETGYNKVVKILENA